MKAQLALLTGASGFLGTHVLDKLKRAGYQVDTLGRRPVADTHSIPADLGQSVPTIHSVYDLVIHAGGHAHVNPRTKEQEAVFDKVNRLGTYNLLKGLQVPPKHFVLISTVAVYGISQGRGIHEDTPLLAKDAYGRSKIAAEKLTTEWCAAHEVPLTILRLPLMIGKNAPGNFGDMMRYLRKGRFFMLPGFEHTRRSMVLASDVALLIGSDALKPGIFNLTDGQHPTYAALATALAKAMHVRRPIRLPEKPLRLAAQLGDFGQKILGKTLPINTARLKKLQSTLTFDDTRARTAMAWSPKSVLQSLDEVV